MNMNMVTGPFGNLSSDFSTLVDLRAMRTMKLRCTNPALELAVGAAHRHSHLSWLGSAYCRPLARCSDKPPYIIHTTEIDLAADEFLSDNPHRGGYHGMHAWRLKHQAFADHFFLCLYYAVRITLRSR